MCLLRADSEVKMFTPPPLLTQTRRFRVSSKTLFWSCWSWLCGREKAEELNALKKMAPLRSAKRQSIYTRHSCYLSHGIKKSALGRGSGAHAWRHSSVQKPLCQELRPDCSLGCLETDLRMTGRFGRIREEGCEHPSSPERKQTWAYRS